MCNSERKSIIKICKRVALNNKHFKNTWDINTHKCINPLIHDAYAILKLAAIFHIQQWWNPLFLCCVYPIIFPCVADSAQTENSQQSLIWQKMPHNISTSSVFSTSIQQCSPAHWRLSQPEAGWAKRRFVKSTVHRIHNTEQNTEFTLPQPEITMLQLNYITTSYMLHQISVALYIYSI